MEELVEFLASCEFATPLYFWIGGGLVLLLIFLPWLQRRRRIPIDLRYWKQKVTFKTNRVWIFSILVVLVSILMAGVLSDPQATSRIKTAIYGKPVIIAVDVSGSMASSAELQAQQSGREMAIAAFNELINRREDISFGLVIFSTDNYIARYFTYKNELFKATLENKAEIDRISQGTRVAEALEKARQFFNDNISSEDKAIVLISDFNIDPKLAAEMVEEIEKNLLEGIKLYIVTTEGENQTTVSIPQMSGLKVLDITDKPSIDQMYEELSAMQSTVIREEEGLLKETLIPFFILPAFGIISLCLILSETRYRKIP